MGDLKAEEHVFRNSLKIHNKISLQHFSYAYLTQYLLLMKKRNTYIVSNRES